MGWQASHWAKTQKTGSATAKAVLLALAEETDRWGFAWTGELAIADYAEISDRQVRRVVKALAEHGLIAIFQAREKDGRLRNLYRLNYDATPHDSLPEAHPYQGDRYKLKWGRSIDDPGFEPPDNLSGGSHRTSVSGGTGLEAAEDCQSGPGCTGKKPPDKLSGGSEAGPPDTEGQATGHGGSNHRTPMSGEPVTEPVTEPGAPGRARDPVGAAHPVAPDGGGEDEPPDDGDGDGEDEALPDPPVNALWRDREAAIRARLGTVEFDAWFGDAIPHSDDGEVYVLAVPGPFQADRINGQYSRILAGMLGRREVRAEFHPYAKVAAHNRKQAGGG